MKIYIPLWIDFNIDECQILFNSRDIYIPLWIDFNFKGLNKALDQTFLFTFHSG